MPGRRTLPPPAPCSCPSTPPLHGARHGWVGGLWGSGLTVRLLGGLTEASRLGGVSVSTGGVSTGGVSTGGVSTGGVSTGGVSTGGCFHRRLPTGGFSTRLPTGGVSSGGLYSGGLGVGGVSTGGDPCGGVSAGGVSSCGGPCSHRADPVRIRPTEVARASSPKRSDSLPTRPASHRFRDPTVSPSLRTGARRRRWQYRGSPERATARRRTPRSRGSGDHLSSEARDSAIDPPFRGRAAAALYSPPGCTRGGYNGRGIAQTALRNPSGGVPRCEDERIFGQSF